MCTFDHLSKVEWLFYCLPSHIARLCQQGTCSSKWAGFDNCSVVVADEIKHNCQANLDASLIVSFSIMQLNIKTM